MSGENNLNIIFRNSVTILAIFASIPFSKIGEKKTMGGYVFVPETLVTLKMLFRDPVWQHDK